VICGYVVPGKTVGEGGDGELDGECVGVQHKKLWRTD